MAAFFAALEGETCDEVFVAIADDIQIADARRAQVEALVVEIREDVLEASVPVLGFTQAFLVVEGNSVEDTFELGLVRILDVPQGLINEFAEVVGIALAVKAVEIAAGRELAALAFEALDHFRLAGELFLKCLAALLDEIG